MCCPLESIIAIVFSQNRRAAKKYQTFHSSVFQEGLGDFEENMHYELNRTLSLGHEGYTCTKSLKVQGQGQTQHIFFPHSICH